jgi:hypothetical protein
VDHRDRIAEEGLLGKHVDLPELPVHVDILTGYPPKRIFLPSRIARYPDSSRTAADSPGRWSRTRT